VHAVLDPNTGLVYLGARWYDPATGQFTSADPLEAITGQPYAYTGDNPIDATDPTGLQLCLVVLWRVEGRAAGAANMAAWPVL